MATVSPLGIASHYYLASVTTCLFGCLSAVGSQGDADCSLSCLDVSGNEKLSDGILKVTVEGDLRTIGSRIPVAKDVAISLRVRSAVG